MALAFDAIANAAQTATVSQTIALTVANDAVLLAFVGSKAAGSVSAVAYGSQPLTRLGRIDSSQMTVEVWGLTAPTAGTANLSANYANAGTRRQLVGVSYTGARATEPFGSVHARSMSATAGALSISASTTWWVVGALCCSTYISATNLTARLNAQDDMGMYVGDSAGAATFSLSAVQITDATGNWAMAGIPLILSVDAVTVLPMRALLGVGR